MARQKKNNNIDEVDEIVRLEKELKQYKEIVKSLERQLKKRDKKYKPEYSSEKLVKADYDEKYKCPNCGKGNIKIVDLGVRKIESCTVGCDYRKVSKK